MKDFTLRPLNQSNAHIFGKSPLRFSGLYFALMKRCTKCKMHKCFSDFYLRGGKSSSRKSRCIDCLKAQDRINKSKNKKKIRAYNKKYRESDPAKNSERKRIYRENNREKVKEAHRNWSKKNREKLRLRSKKWRQDNPDYMNEYSKFRKENDLGFKIKNNSRSRISSAIKKGQGLKRNQTVTLIGCSWSDLKLHLESQFKLGMTWENYGRDGWHIDHIIPCASFNLKDEFQQKVCFHWTNLQPMWAKENICKSDKVEDGAQPNLPI